MPTLTLSYLNRRQTRQLYTEPLSGVTYHLFDIVAVLPEDIPGQPICADLMWAKIVRIVCVPERRGYRGYALLRRLYSREEIVARTAHDTRDSDTSRFVRSLGAREYVLGAGTEWLPIWRIDHHADITFMPMDDITFPPLPPNSRYYRNHGSIQRSHLHPGRLFVSGYQRICTVECTRHGLFHPDLEQIRFCPTCFKWFHLDCLHVGPQTTADVVPSLGNDVLQGLAAVPAQRGPIFSHGWLCSTEMTTLLARDLSAGNDLSVYWNEDLAFDVLQWMPDMALLPDCGRAFLNQVVIHAINLLGRQNYAVCPQCNHHI
ncbi:hypothetical protein NLI96_g11928 [Meripilus lineatus]|uniref:Uncharacterized protein n=1 Tax=Meripilus lineatus TaxID=2056292 RepID=A0AAD5Y819_9APHY|nr:hypothetical protein NLI96_g11928 [Physisporinus lineatus]